MRIVNFFVMNSSKISTLYVVYSTVASCYMPIPIPTPKRIQLQVVGCTVTQSIFIAVSVSDAVLAADCVSVGLCQFPADAWEKTF